MKDIKAKIVNVINTSDIGCLNIGPSKDNKVYYHDLYADYEFSEGIFTLKNYFGQLLIPSCTGFNLEDTENGIQGTVTFPSMIHCRGDINLKIPEDTYLNLCFAGKGYLEVNRQIISPLNKEMIEYGSDFEEYNQAYDMLGKFENKKFHELNVCMQYNLVGIISHNYAVLRYKEIDRSLLGIQRQDTFATISRLERQIDQCVSEENYEKAAKYKKLLDEEKSILDRYPILTQRNKG